MVQAWCESAAPETDQCVACDRVVKNIVLCADCGPATYLCLKCTEKYHKFVHFHKPLLWTVSKLLCIYSFCYVLLRARGAGSPSTDRPLSRDETLSVNPLVREQVTDFYFTKCIRVNGPRKLKRRHQHWT